MKGADVFSFWTSEDLRAGQLRVNDAQDSDIVETKDVSGSDISRSVSRVRMEPI